MKPLYFENQHKDCIGQEHKYTLYVAFRDDPELRVIGYIQYTTLHDELFVDYVEVKEELRRQGIGKALYRKLYELNKDCSFKESGYYTEPGSKIRKWFNEEVLGGKVA
ncbi:GNAT family N-acetyltransferase [Alkalihalobacillus sp. BA299]|uniref:GNAT family N-acetyltransferase n=1 Tax=Alkalihalobacillus sp. BA299 TaxID=2815938 RepID=UPI001ADAA9A0|nr:GNAT family N-acetyltransferase [Alkalihalobacillus sp. BA299]